MPTQQIIGARLRNIRESPAVDLSQEAVARAVKVSLKTWQNYEAGRNKIPVGKLEAFCQLTGASIGQILYDNPEFDSMKDVHPLRRIPIVNEIPASGFILGFDSPTDEWTYTDNLTEQGLFALRVHGDSMAPRIEDGDLVIIAPDRPFENNKIYAVVIKGDEHTLKTVRKNDGVYLLIPFNQAYEMLTVHAEDVIKLYRVIGMQKVL